MTVLSKKDFEAFAKQSGAHIITHSEDIGYISAHCTCGWSASVDKVRGKDHMTTDARLGRKVAGHRGGTAKHR